MRLPNNLMPEVGSWIFLPVVRRIIAVIRRDPAMRGESGFFVAAKRDPITTSQSCLCAASSISPMKAAECWPSASNCKAYS